MGARSTQRSSSIGGLYMAVVNPMVLGGFLIFFPGPKCRRTSKADR